MPEEPNVIPAAEVARAKGCTRQAVYNAIDRGDLTGVRVGTSRLVMLDAKYERYQVQETGGRAHEAYRKKEEPAQ